MRLFKIIAGFFVVLAASLSPAAAQSSTVTVTNFVTVTITNIVTVTNFVQSTAAPTNAVAPAKAAAAAVAAIKITAPPKPRWASTLTAGVTLTRGNSSTLLTTAKILSDKKTPDNEYHLGADGTYGSASGVANTELYEGHAQWNHLFSPKWYSYLRGEGLHDGISEVKYRFTLTSGVGYYLIKQTNTTLSAEAGPGIVIQRLGDTDNTYATMRLAERFEHKFDDTPVRIWENAEFLPQINKPSDYLVNSEIGVESAFYKKVDLQVFLDDYFNSQPASGLKRNDVKLVSGLSYKF